MAVLEENLSQCEDDPGGSLEMQMELACVRLEVYELKGKNICRVGAENDQGQPMKKRKKDPLATPLISSLAGYEKLRKDIERRGRLMKATAASASSTALEAMNFGDDACLGNLLLGSYEFDRLSAALPHAGFADASGTPSKGHDDDLCYLKHKLCFEKDFHKRVASFLTRQEQRGCPEIVLWYLGDPKVRKSNRFSSAESKRQVLLTGRVPDGCTEILVLDVKFEFSGRLYYDGMDDDDF
eukprot:TRINITY_DN467_c2_g2_i1.p1 TRINITY_DN467_c2_g2~~TRINITY_DN467_c2_g2_i1.p1  ORF type:complete len:263 (+),score=63.18 TRINITY_DN467_c2_g2_i1:72-791(+)